MTDAAAWARVEAAPPPEVAFERVAHLPYSVWLDSSSHESGAGRWSFVAAQPFGLLTARQDRAFWIEPPGSVQPLAGDPLTELAVRLERWGSDAGGPLPLDGGAIGFVGYEAAGRFERLPPSPPGDLDLPDVHLAFFDVVVGWDHRSGECFALSTGRPLSEEAGEKRAADRLAETLDWLRGAATPAPTMNSRATAPSSRTEAIPGRPVEGIPWLESTVSRPEYEASVAHVIEAIREGEVYQVNLSQRFAAATSTTGLQLHRLLRRRSPAPYAAIIRAGGSSVLSSSPETFLRTAGGGTVETRPIKGTRPRGRSEAEDEHLATELLGSEKDRAENLMIVDLLRNDLSRVCRTGSIRVPELYRLESWATVHHLVSTVRGELVDGVGPDELLRATFPSGSVTGAPKIRAMEMIARLERVARGPYCGAIGYFAFGGAIDLSVAIRIVVHEGGGRGRATFHAGGGIVYDSEPAAEYDETMAKARGIIDVIAAARTEGAG